MQTPRSQTNDSLRFGLFDYYSKGDFAMSQKVMRPYNRKIIRVPERAELYIWIKFCVT